MKYRALITSEENKTFINSIEKKDIADLPENDTLIKVKYSSLNYKDALSAYGNKGVTRNFPHTLELMLQVLLKQHQEINLNQEMKLLLLDMTWA